MTAQSNHPLLDRYLAAVGLLLPDAEREDILRELRANLEERLDDIQESAGRSPTEEEVCRILKAHGHPNVVAARYRQQQALIGPMVWPYFIAGLKVVGILVAIGTVFDAIIGTLAAGGLDAWGSFLPRLMIGVFKIGLPLFGLWVILMAIAERGWLHSSNRVEWDPRTLKKEGAGSLAHAWVEGASDGIKSFASGLGQKCKSSAPEATGTVSSAKTRCGEDGTPNPKHGRGEAFSDFFGALVGVAAWYVLFNFPNVLFKNVHFNVAPGEVWGSSYTIVLTLLVLQCVILFLPVIQPFSRSLRHGAKAIYHLIGVVITYQFLNEPLLVAKPLEPGQTDITPFVNWLDQWQHPLILFIVGIGILQFLHRIGRMLAGLFRE
ncbi:MAG: hypothetical protein SFV32_02175 [Opitutaceae bacterium]|nr:hypothetical protein [Opitutaceae bacterium]